MVDPGDMRRDYASAGLDAGDLDPDPIAQFEVWLADAVAGGLPDANAMVVATADAGGATSARMVLLKAVDAAGFVFYTNRTSRKGRELGENPRAALLFPWVALHRQVIVDGAVELVSDVESDAYFASRPRGAQLSAWASRQSSVVESREALEQAVALADARFAAMPVSRPPWWGGYRVVPAAIELWQGRADRLHDRLRYRRLGPGAPWFIERLSP